MSHAARSIVPRVFLGLLLGFSIALSFLPRVEAQLTGTTRVDLGPRLERIEQLLLDGEYKRARKETLRFADYMVGYAGPGRPGEIALARNTLLRALAEAALGNEEDADWYLHVARGIHPQLQHFDVSRFGEPGRLLEEIEIRRNYTSRPQDPGASGNRLTAPRKIKAPQPEWPSGARSFGVTGALVVQMIIDETGRTMKPTVVTPLPAATLTWVALEAVKEWRFEPARLDGKPVAVFYNLTINYRLGGD